MKVYLRSDSYYMHIGNVILKDGYVPTVGVKPLYHLGNVAIPKDVVIEPAIWFKVLFGF